MTPFNVCQVASIVAYGVLIAAAALTGQRAACLWMFGVYLTTSGFLTLGKILTN